MPSGALRGKALKGPKVGPFAEAHRDEQAMAVDGHVATLLINTDMPSEWHIVAAQSRLRQIAKKLAWTPCQAQAAILAANIRRLRYLVEKL